MADKNKEVTTEKRQYKYSTEIAICKRCGREYIRVKKGKNWYCSDECREAARIDAKRTYYYEVEKYRLPERRAKAAAGKRRVANNASLKEICRCASEAGLTYGQYVAKLHAGEII